MQGVRPLQATILFHLITTHMGKAMNRVLVYASLTLVILEAIALLAWAPFGDNSYAYTIAGVVAIGSILGIAAMMLSNASDIEADMEELYRAAYDADEARKDYEASECETDKAMLADGFVRNHEGKWYRMEQDQPAATNRYRKEFNIVSPYPFGTDRRMLN